MTTGTRLLALLVSAALFCVSAPARAAYSETSGYGYLVQIPVELRVWGFALPEKASVRSSFGLPSGDIKAYHNLETREELEKVVDLYYENLREHRVAPTSPFELYPMKVTTSEVFWKGREFWSYLCTGPKSSWVTLFIDHPAVNMRMWLWMTYKWGLKGILVWRADYWNSPTLFPPGVLQNPWADPMSYTVGYGVPFGQVNHWGNGDGRFLYPPNRELGKDKTKYLCGPVNSVRWEILREGIEDYEYFVILERALKDAKGKTKNKGIIGEAARLLEFPAALFTSGTEYTKDPLDLLRYRSKVAEMIEKLTAR